MSLDINESAPANVGTLSFSVGSMPIKPGLYIEEHMSGERFSISNDSDPREVVAELIEKLGPMIWNEGRCDLLEAMKKEVR